MLDKSRGERRLPGISGSWTYGLDSAAVITRRFCSLCTSAWFGGRRLSRAPTPWQLHSTREQDTLVCAELGMDDKVLQLYFKLR